MVSKKSRAKANRKKHFERLRKQTKWAPFWAVLRKFGLGKRIHPSEITRVRRNWRRTKLKIGPRKIKKDYLG